MAADPEKRKAKYRRYRATEKGREQRRKYNCSESGRARNIRYNHTRKGRRRKWNQRQPFGALLFDMRQRNEDAST